MSLSSSKAPKPPLVIAHRGANDGRPELENKLPAFERALAIGADMVECDVHLSADNEPVVIHDETLDRTTTGSGCVKAHTAAELRRLGVPTLRELCRLVRGKARLLVEIKSAGPSSVLDAILAEKMQREVIVFSFHPEHLRPIASLRPDIELAFLLSRFDASVPDLASFIALGRELRATTLAPRRTLCTPRLVRAVHAAGLRVFAWTADSPRQQRALIAAGVDGIITNFPERLKTLL
ncbi:MAG: glycerophosphodiester phosphodiesterase family protein [Verrucomicrobiia bacterium]